MMNAPKITFMGTFILLVIVMFYCLWASNIGLEMRLDGIKAELIERQNKIENDFSLRINKLERQRVRRWYHIF